ncbi:MAG: baseplate J/gp47 family protein [Campylobacter sp.]|nr:baseplate J/gp47 family protein [Campylobacter sp.]
MLIPNFIKDFDIEQEKAKILQAFKERSGKLDYIPLIGDDYSTLTDIYLEQLAQYFETWNYIISQNYIQFSSGEYLDALVALIGITRKEATAPQADITIRANSPTFLPKGTKFHDGAGHFAYLFHNVNIDDTLEANARLEAGWSSKESYETINLEIDNIYIDSIELKNEFVGYEVRESDEDLRARFLLALHRFSTAGSKESYEFYILSIEGIEKVSVRNGGAGVVKIVYKSKFDDQTTKDKINQALIGRIPLTDNLEFVRANEIALDLHIQIEPTSDYNYTLAQNECDANIKTLFSSLDIAYTPHSSAIIDAAFNKYCSKVEIVTPIPQVNADDILILNSLQITKT